MSPLRGSLPNLANAALALLACAWFSWGSDEFSLDDAYIHLAYAKSLWLGDGFSYNPGDHELGSTSPLWALMLAPLSLSPHVVALTKGLGALLHALAAVFTGLVARALLLRMGDGATDRTDRFASLTAGALVALHPLLIQGAVSGMELPLTVALLASAVWLALRDSVVGASALFALAVWARPEALVFAWGVSASLALAQRNPRMLLPCLASGLAMLLWSGYCLVQKGSVLPNTFYAKSGGTLAASGAFLLKRVLAEEPWLLGLTGGWLVGRHLVRRRCFDTFAALALAWLVTLLCTAFGRELNPIVLFYQQRYFGVAAFVPCALVGALIATQIGPRRALFAVPCLAAALAMGVVTRERVIAQEHSIRVLHTEVAAYVVRHVPPAARIVVEGAGTLRYYTDRRMRVIDLIGLNDHALVHAPDLSTRLCLIAARIPTHLAIPGEFLRPLANLFEGRVLARFTEPRFAHVTRPMKRVVSLIEITGLRPQALEQCRRIAEGKAE